MAEFTVNPTRYDPYKTHMFRVKWDGVYVAGLSKMSPLTRTTAPVVAPRRRRPLARPAQPGPDHLHVGDARTRGHPRPGLRGLGQQGGQPTPRRASRCRTSARTSPSTSSTRPASRCSAITCTAAGCRSTPRCPRWTPSTAADGDPVDQDRDRGLGTRRRRGRAERAERLSRWTGRARAGLGRCRMHWPSCAHLPGWLLLRAIDAADTEFGEAIALLGACGDRRRLTCRSGLIDRLLLQAHRAVLRPRPGAGRRAARRAASSTRCPLGPGDVAAYAPRTGVVRSRRRRARTDRRRPARRCRPPRRRPPASWCAGAHGPAGRVDGPDGGLPASAQQRRRRVDQSLCGPVTVPCTELRRPVAESSTSSTWSPPRSRTTWSRGRPRGAPARLPLRLGPGHHRSASGGRRAGWPRSPGRGCDVQPAAAAWWRGPADPRPPWPVSQGPPLLRHRRRPVAQGAAHHCRRWRPRRQPLRRRDRRSRSEPIEVPNPMPPCPAGLRRGRRRRRSGRRTPARHRRHRPGSSATAAPVTSRSAAPVGPRTGAVSAASAEPRGRAADPARGPGAGFVRIQPDRPRPSTTDRRAPTTSPARQRSDRRADGRTGSSQVRRRPPRSARCRSRTRDAPPAQATSHRRQRAEPAPIIGAEQLETVGRAVAGRLPAPDRVPPVTIGEIHVHVAAARGRRAGPAGACSRRTPAA